MLIPVDDREFPVLTKLVARIAFPDGREVRMRRDELGLIFDDETFAYSYPRLGLPAESPARRALSTVMQFIEKLTDRPAADAVRGRIDWNYAPGLEFSDPGFHYSILREFRLRIWGLDFASSGAEIGSATRSI